MVRVPGMERPGAVDLLDEQHTHQSVGQGQVRQADAPVRGLAQGRVQPVGPADEQRHRVADQLPAPQPFGQGQGGQTGAALVQRHHLRAARDGRLDTPALGSKHAPHPLSRTSPQPGPRSPAATISSFSGADRWRPVQPLRAAAFLRAGLAVAPALAAGLFAPEGLITMVSMAAFLVAVVLPAGLPAGLAGAFFAGLAADGLTGFAAVLATIFLAGALAAALRAGFWSAACAVVPPDEGEKGLAAPSLMRTGLSPQRSSRR